MRLHSLTAEKILISACATCLEGIGTSKWSRTYFPNNRYNLLTSNIAEQLNNALTKSRSSPIIELFMFIQRMLTRWFSARRTKSAKCRGFVTPEVEKVMQTHIRLTKGSKIANITDWSYQVRGLFGHANTVSLEKKKLYLPSVPETQNSLRPCSVSC